MGISGLLPFLKKSSRPCHVREMSHSTVAVDVYCWLHKGAFGCAEKLVQNQPTNGYVIYVMKYVDLLLYHNIKVVILSHVTPCYPIAKSSQQHQVRPR